MIDKCMQLYKFVDYLHDKRKPVPLKYTTSEPQKYIIDAHLYKLKADILNFIFECLGGENGALIYDYQRDTSDQIIGKNFRNFSE